MITSPAFRGGRYGVFGLARTGQSVVRALAASGSEVVAWDDRADAQAAARAYAQIVDLNSRDLSDLDALVVSPGVPLNTHPLAARARAARVPLIGDIELFALARPYLPAHRVVGITGTNGKSTTTALIHHVLASAGIPARLGGNIGLPVLDGDPLPAGASGPGVYVLELSSYQIDLTASLDCDVAVLLNITPDHLDRYDEGFAGYAASKERLFALQSAGHAAIIVDEDDTTRAIAERVEERGAGDVVRARTTDIAAGAWDQSQWPALAGPHNAQNAAAAIAALRALGLPDGMIAQGLRTYPGLPHRMERVATRRGVHFVNDSKATNPTSAAPALAAFDRIHWIAGGRAKSAELNACLPHLGHVKAAYLIGEAAPAFAEILRPHVPVSQPGELGLAVREAVDAAAEGDTVLLSPACASFDQFSDFEARGRAFREAVEALVQ
jgi:UDP-N-acetylmuramoylalanine--D-glutamate ligase